MQRGEVKRLISDRYHLLLLSAISTLTLIITILAPALDYVMSSTLNCFLLNFLSISSFGALGPYRTGVSYKLDNDKVSFISAL